MGRLSRPVRSRLRPRPRHRATRPHPSTTFNTPAHARTQPQGPSAGTAYRGRVSAPSGTGPRCGGAGKAARWPPFQSPSRGRWRRTLSQQPLHGSRPHKTPGPHANPRHGRRQAQRVNPDPTDRHLSRSFEIAMARRRSQPPNQPREIALRPVRGRLSCPAGQPKVPTSIRSLCSGWFRASNVITDTVRFERSSAARGSAVARKAETIGLEAMARRRAPIPATAGCRPHATPGPAAETAGSMTGSTSGSEGGSSPKPVRNGLSGESRLSGCATTHRIRPAVFPTTRDARCPRADTCARTLLVTPGTADPARAQDTTCLPSSPTTRAGQVTTSCNLVGIYRPHDPRDRQQQQRRVPAAERRLSGSEGGSGRNPSGSDSGEANRADVRRRGG